MLVAYDVVVYKKTAFFRVNLPSNGVRPCISFSTSSTGRFLNLPPNELVTEQNSQLCGHPRVVSIKCTGRYFFPLYRFQFEAGKFANDG